LGVVGYFGYKNLLIKPSPASSAIIPYSSSKFGFTLDYQKDSKIYYDSEAAGEPTNEPYEYLLKMANDGIQKDDPNGYLYFLLEIDTKQQNDCSNLIKLPTDNNIKNFIQKDITVGGVSTKIVNFTGAYDLDYSEICLPKNNLFYDFSTQGSTDLNLKSVRDKYFLDVINSFKFTK
jgi:hypothetical protein